MVSYQYYWVFHINMIFINIGACCGLIYSSQLLYNLFFEKNNKNKLLFKKVFLFKGYTNTIYIIYSVLLVIIYTYISWFIFFTKNSLTMVAGHNIMWFNLFFIKTFYKNFLLLIPVFFKKLKKPFIMTYLIIILYVFFPFIVFFDFIVIL